MHSSPSILLRGASCARSAEGGSVLASIRWPRCGRVHSTPAPFAGQQLRRQHNAPAGPAEDVSNVMLLFHDPVADCPYPHEYRTPSGQSYLDFHNSRVRLDWAESRQMQSGRGDSEALGRRIQERREADMLRSAYELYMKELDSTVTRECTSAAPPAQRLLNNWVPPISSSISLLQDCILFRDSDLGALIESNELPWLGDTAAAAAAMVTVPRGTSEHDRLRRWAPYLCSLRGDEQATIVASVAMQYSVRKLLDTTGRSKDSGSLKGRGLPVLAQTWLSLVKDVGRKYVEQSNMHLAHACSELRSRQVRAHNRLAVLAKDARLPEEIEALAPYAKPLTIKFEIWEQVKTMSMVSAMLYSRELLGPSHVLRLSSDTVTMVGAALVHLLSTQATVKSQPQILDDVHVARTQYPAFLEPVPWTFRPHFSSADASSEDFDLQPSEWLQHSLIGEKVVGANIQPLYGVCTLKPQPWRNPNQGAYYQNLHPVEPHMPRPRSAFTVELLRTRSVRQVDQLWAAHNGAAPPALLATGTEEDSPWEPPLLQRLGDAQGLDDPPDRKASRLRLIYRALDILGSQAWLVHDRVLKVLEDVWDSGGGIGEVPQQHATPLAHLVPPRFQACSTSKLIDSPKGARKVTLQLRVAFQDPPYVLQRSHVELRQSVMKQNRETASQRATFLLQLQTAKANAGAGKIYFPHNLDFRGRAYPMPPHLNHMSADVCRGLLLFGEARALGPHGFRWLLIHLANLCGVVDKQSFDAREAWARAQLSHVLDSAASPLGGSRWWLQAECPWQALAVCMEISDALASGDVCAFQSSLPVHQDGSCNGLQHYAALGRDEEGARVVNLLDSPEPQDVYSAVANMVRAQVAKDSNEPGAKRGKGSLAGRAAVKLQGQVDRKLVKQTVMTSVYGVTYIGARDQIEHRLKERGWTNRNDMKLASSYAARITQASLKGMFANASTIMGWLADVAREVSRNGGTETDAHGKPLGDIIQWTTPLGLPISQPYRNKSKSLVRTVANSIALEAFDQLPVAKQKQKTALPPNFVHSLDATHLMMTALACHERGLAFAGVHDSYWTHAGNVDTCRDVLRDNFVTLYSEPLLRNMRDELQAAHPHIYPHGSLDTPPQGDLDITRVRNSTYFFN